MEDVFKLIIGILVLILGIPIGNYLAKITKEEIKDGQKWFKIIITISLILGFFGLIIRNDFILFSGFFIAIVTSKSLKKKKKK